MGSWLSSFDHIPSSHTPDSGNTTTLPTARSLTRQGHIQRRTKTYKQDPSTLPRSLRTGIFSNCPSIYLTPSVPRHVNHLFTLYGGTILPSSDEIKTVCFVSGQKDKFLPTLYMRGPVVFDYRWIEACFVAGTIIPLDRGFVVWPWRYTGSTRFIPEELFDFEPVSEELICENDFAAFEGRKERKIDENKSDHQARRGTDRLIFSGQRDGLPRPAKKTQSHKRKSELPQMNTDRAKKSKAFTVHSDSTTTEHQASRSTAQVDNKLIVTKLKAQGVRNPTSPMRFSDSPVSSSMQLFKQSLVDSHMSRPPKRPSRDSDIHQAKLPRHGSDEDRFPQGRHMSPSPTYQISTTPLDTPPTRPSDLAKKGSKERHPVDTKIPNRAKGDMNRPIGTHYRKDDRLRNPRKSFDVFDASYKISRQSDPVRPRTVQDGITRGYISETFIDNPARFQGHRNHSKSSYGYDLFRSQAMSPQTMSPQAGPSNSRRSG